MALVVHGEALSEGQAAGSLPSLSESEDCSRLGRMCDAVEPSSLVSRTRAPVKPSWGGSRRLLLSAEAQGSGRRLFWIAPALEELSLQRLASQSTY